MTSFGLDTELFAAVAFAICVVILSSVLIQNVLGTIQLALALRAFRRQAPLAHRKQLWQRYGDITMPISLLVPA